MCVHFFNFDHLRITHQSSDLIPLSLSLHSFSLTFKLLSMASYGGELVLDSSSPWRGISNHIFSFSIPLPLIFKKQRTPLMKKIQGLQSPHGATSFFFVVCCEIFFMKEWLLLVEPYLVDSLRRSVVWYLLCVECNYSQERIIVVNEYTCVISLWSLTSLHY